MPGRGEGCKNIEDTWTFTTFILLSSSNKTCSIADNIWKLTETRYCVHADVVVVDILVKLLVFHEEKPVDS